MKICWVPYGEPTTASTRLRCYAIHKALLRRGVESAIGLCPCPDVVVIQKRFDHIALQQAYLAMRSGARLFVDCDDVGPGLCPGRDDLLRNMRTLVRVAHRVTTATPEQQQYIREHYLRSAPARWPRVVVLPNPADYDLTAPRRRKHAGRGPLKVVWFGYSQNLVSVSALLDVVCSLPDTVVSLITDVPAPLAERWPSARLIPWQLETFRQELGRFDVCVLSHLGEEFRRAKSGHKMITSILCGVPVVASRTPDYERIAAMAGVSEYLFDDASEVPRRLDALRDPDARNAYLEKAQGVLWDGFNPDRITGLFMQQVQEALESEEPRSDRLELLRCLASDPRFAGAPSGPAAAGPKRGPAARVLAAVGRVVRPPAGSSRSAEVRRMFRERLLPAARRRVGRWAFRWRVRLFLLGWRGLLPAGEIRLHVGCGPHYREGYVNVDPCSPCADLRRPIRALNFPPDSVSLIEGYHVIEHLPPEEAKAFCRSAYRMLRPGGRLVLECPDLLRACRLVSEMAESEDLLEKSPFGLRAFYGCVAARSGSQEDLHKWGYTPRTMRSMLKEAGFERVEVGDGHSDGLPLRDMRVEAVKQSGAGSGHDWHQVRGEDE